MSVVKGVNVSTLSVCSESDSDELEQIIERNEVRLDSAEEIAVQLRKRILSAILKQRIKAARKGDRTTAGVSQGPSASASAAAS